MCAELFRLIVRVVWRDGLEGCFRGAKRNVFGISRQRIVYKLDATAAACSDNRKMSACIQCNTMYTHPPKPIGTTPSSTHPHRQPRNLLKRSADSVRKVYTPGG